MTSDRFFLVCLFACCKQFFFLVTQTKEQYDLIVPFTVDEKSFINNISKLLSQNSLLCKKKNG